MGRLVIESSRAGTGHNGQNLIPSWFWQGHGFLDSISQAVLQRVGTQPTIDAITKGARWLLPVDRFGKARVGGKVSPSCLVLSDQAQCYYALLIYQIG